MVSAAGREVSSAGSLPWVPVASTVPRTRRVSVLIVVLGLLTAVTPLTIDMYVPGFPAMAAALRTGGAAVQLTMTAFLAGLVAGQVVIGPVSDKLGRRGLLVWGSVAYVVLSLACAFAPVVQVLIGARFLQGVAAAAGTVLARAVITDLYAGPELPRYFALLSQILGVAPVAAPVLGGAILSFSTWRTIFGVLCGIGVLLLAGVLVKVPETLPPERRHTGGLAGTFRAMGGLARNRPFLGNALVLGLGMAALFGYISGSSFVFERVHGVSPGVFSLIFAVNAAGMITAGSAFSRLSRRYRLNTLLSVAITIAVAAAAVQVAGTVLLGENFAFTWICLFVIVWALGMAFPAAMSLGQTIGHRTSGAASALLGALQFLLGALVSPLAGLFGDASSLPMAVIMLAALALAALALVVLVRPREGHGEVGTG